LESDFEEQEEADPEEQLESDSEEQKESDPKELSEADLEEQYGETSTSALARRTIKTVSDDDDDDEYQDDSEHIFLPRQCVRKYKNRPKSDINLPDDGPIIDDDPKSDDNNESSESSEFTTEEDDNSNDSQSESELSNGEEYEILEDYSPPDYELFSDPPDVRSMIDG